MKILNLDQHFTEVSSYESNGQQVSIGLGNGMVPIRRQTIIWTNADPVQRRIYATLGEI